MVWGRPRKVGRPFSFRKSRTENVPSDVTDILDIFILLWFFIWNSPMNSYASSKYCFRFCWPESLAGILLWVIPAEEGSPGNEHVTFRTQVAPNSFNLSISAASLPLPRYKKGSTRDAGWLSISENNIRNICNILSKIYWRMIHENVRNGTSSSASLHCIDYEEGNPYGRYLHGTQNDIFFNCQEIRWIMKWERSHY